MSLPLRPSSLLARPTEDTTPAVTVLQRDNGEPSAATNSPGLRSLDLPNGAGLSLHCKARMKLYMTVCITQTKMFQRTPWLHPRKKECIGKNLLKVMKDNSTTHTVAGKPPPKCMGAILQLHHVPKVSLYYKSPITSHHA